MIIPKYWFFICIAGTLLLAALTVPSRAAAQRTEISNEPWVPSPAKVVYGADDRRDLYEVTDPMIRGLAASTCGIVDVSDLSDNGDGTYHLATSAYRVFGLTGCPDEPFITQPTAPFCSAFMVGPQLIATAGHCFNGGDLGVTAFVFGFVMESRGTVVRTLDMDQVYFPQRIVGRRLSGNYDYAVVEVDRPITAPDAYSLPIRREGVVPIDQQVGVIGHPAGLPLKIAFGSNTRVNANGNDGYFVANLDTYGGNSGSPVFNQSTGVVEGILVRGASDYDIVGNCFVSNQLSDSAGSEDCSKTTSFDSLIPELTQGDHKADTNGNNKIDLSEVLRVIQLYNVTAFGCSASSEDGFSTSTTDQSCDPHSADYAPQDWALSIEELLRVIQFFNLGGYTLCETGEDGFCLP